METYRVRVFTPGHKLIFKGKVVRSPVTFSKVTKTDLALIESQTRRSLLKIEVLKESEIKLQEEIKKQLIAEIPEKVIVEELEIKEPTTTLEKLISDNKE